MILKNNSERVINLVKYFERINIENKLKMIILVFKSDLIKFARDKEETIEILENFLCTIDKNYNKNTIIFLEYCIDVFILAMVMEMNEEEQKNFIFEMLFSIYYIIKNM